MKECSGSCYVNRKLYLLSLQHFRYHYTSCKRFNRWILIRVSMAVTPSRFSSMLWHTISINVYTGRLTYRNHWCFAKQEIWTDRNNWWIDLERHVSIIQVLQSVSPVFDFWIVNRCSSVRYFFFRRSISVACQGMSRSFSSSCSLQYVNVMI